MSRPWPTISQRFRLIVSMRVGYRTATAAFTAALARMPCFSSAFIARNTPTRLP